MTKRFLTAATLALSLAALPEAATAQDPAACYLRGASPAEAGERASPLGVTMIQFGEGAIAQLCYGRPSANDREIFGGLVPHGELWRLGANEATAIHLPFAAEIGGVAVEPGVYSIYVIPGEDEWTFYLNTNWERWGIGIGADIRATEVGSFTRPVEETDQMVETMTATWESHGEMMGHLVFEWADTRVEVPIHHGHGMMDHGGH